MEEDLSIIAKEHMIQGFQKNEDILSRVSALEGHLNDVFCSRQPITRDYDDRRDLIRIINEIAKEIYGKNSECPVVEGFGSFSMDMFSAKSDLDLSINFCDKNIEARRDVKIKALRKFANKFYSLQKKEHVKNVQAVLSARVPVLKVTDCATGIECDLSVGNKDAIAKSHIILLISSIDERFKKLCFLMKAWAKAHDINSSRDGTLNSLSLVLLSAFHLQNREPPILPPFSEIFTDGIDPEVVEKKIHTFVNYGNGNKESLATLFVSLLVMLESVETLWGMGLCASTYEGSWIYKTWHSKKGDRNGLISTEDFTDRSQNTARAVRIKTFTKIFTCIRHSIEHIRSFTSGKIDAETLMNRLFGTDAHPTPTQQPNLQDSTQGKRKHSKEKREKKNSKKKHKSSIGGAQAHPPPHLIPHLHTNPPVPSLVEHRNAGYNTEIYKSSKLESSIGGVQAHARPPLHTNPPVQRSVGHRNEGIYAEMWRYSKKPDSSSIGGVRAHAPLHLNPPLHSNPPIQSSVGFRNEANHAEFWRYSKKPDNCNIGGVQAHTPPHFRPPFHTNPPIQHSVGFRDERSHSEIRSYPTPNHHYHHEGNHSLASRPGSGEMPYYPSPNHHYHHEGNHSLASRPGNGEMPYYPTPYVPHPVSYVPHLGFERAYNGSQPLPSNPFSGPDNTNVRGFGSYNTSVETNHRPNPGVYNGAHPPFIYRGP